MKDFLLRTVTVTEVARIQHTIQSLKESEAELGRKVENLGQLENTDIISRDISQHSREILWGWQQLKRAVERMPNEFFEKTFYLRETDEGINRAESHLYPVDGFFEPNELRELFL